MNKQINTFLTVFRKMMLYPPILIIVWYQTNSFILGKLDEISIFSFLELPHGVFSACVVGMPMLLLCFLKGFEIVTELSLILVALFEYVLFWELIKRKSYRTIVISIFLLMIANGLSFLLAVFLYMK